MNQTIEHISVRFWGVRGSLPSPGPSTVRYGGNTPCVSIEGSYRNGRKWTAMFDAGTGARLLGQELIQNENDIFFFLTHTHWDHIQGFPFFAPIYQAERKIYLSHLEERRGLFNLLLEQMDGRRFPITQDQIMSLLISMSTEDVEKRSREGYHVDRLRVNHPGETHGFRLHIRDLKVVYIPDNEIDTPNKPWVTFDKLVEFCQDADLLIHDAQYLKEDMPAKRGWGHSIAENVWELALQAKVKQLALFHHDPDRTDDQLDDMLVKSVNWFREKGANVVCHVAYEGLELNF
ncbi:MAG: MBL fold metallo-hydrolase [Rhodothermales bacterium]